MDIQVNDVSKIYGTGENRVVALCHANMTIHSGDFISIMGPSGSGKSTLLHIISGLDTPTSGKVLYGDTDIHHGSDQGVIGVPPPKDRLHLPAIQSAPGADSAGEYYHAAASRQAASRTMPIYRRSQPF